ncbi:hypothetical protein [uncultured Luteimonas sp.]|uniref:hypothetical protein n=1 Tax=uncultured Luteimonas sp. TaxID=453144 RepID=UPI00262D45C0|nr:hypothetical protein [uncultured Luteimonas sp.]
MSAPTQPQVRAGQVWSDCERGRVRVIAVADGYAMLKRRRRNPFLASVDQMQRGEYGWELVEDTPPSSADAVAPAAEPLRYFAYDSDNGDYNEYDTLPEAVSSAQEALDYAGDDGWPDGGPSIVYGAVLGEAREVEGSRRPAGPDDPPDFDFIVEYELTPPPSAFTPKPEARGVVDEAWMQTARELYDRCRLWPESTDDGFMALLELRNHVQSILTAAQQRGQAAEPTGWLHFIEWIYGKRGPTYSHGPTKPALHVERVDPRVRHLVEPTVKSERFVPLFGRAQQQQGQAVCECPHLDMSEPPQHHDPHCPGRKRGQAVAWTEASLRDEAKRRGWYVREGTSVPTVDGDWRHPFSVTAESRDLLELLNSQPMQQGGGEELPVCVCCEDCGTEIEAYCPKCNTAPPSAPVGVEDDDGPGPVQVPGWAWVSVESFDTIAEALRQSAGPHIGAINEGGDAGEDEISEVFDGALNHVKRAVASALAQQPAANPFVGVVCPECNAEYEATARQPAAVDEAMAEGWRVMPFTGSWQACDERWEVYSPDGSGGVVLASEVRSRDVADLLDAIATQHQEPKSHG